MSNPTLKRAGGRVSWAAASGASGESGFSNGFHAGRDVSPVQALAGLAAECARLAAVQSPTDGETVLAEVQNALRRVREWRRERDQQG